MANRMEIELTSARDDDTFTWRAAGARQPRGSVASSLLPPAAKVGDVLRAEVEIELDGITVLSVVPPKEKQSASGLIEHVGSGRPTPGVTTVLASRGERRGPPLERGRGRFEGGGDAKRTPPRRSSTERPRQGADEARPTSRRSSQKPSRATAGRPSGEEPRREQREVERRRGPARFEPGTAHRDELLAGLGPEQRPVAERLATGGMPAVRKALSEEQERAKKEGRLLLSGEPIVAIAEELAPQVKAAVWLDRAEAAVERADEISLRDLRMTVLGASPRDETGRELEKRLREALERRVAKLRADWESHLAQAMEEKRVLQALRLSARPPEPTARFPGQLAARLAALAGAAMTAETSPERWLSLLAAASESPVRRQVKPEGMPADESKEVERQARMAASRIPALARLLGMPIPPPPRPVPGERLRRGGQAVRRFSAGRARPTRSATATAEPAARSEITSEPGDGDGAGAEASSHPEAEGPPAPGAEQQPVGESSGSGAGGEPQHAALPDEEVIGASDEDREPSRLSDGLSEQREGVEGDEEGSPETLAEGEAS